MMALARLETGCPGKCAPARAGPVTDRRAALVASRVLARRSPALAENTALPDAPIALRLHIKHRAEMGYLWLARMEGSNGRTTHIRHRSGAVSAEKPVTFSEMRWSAPTRK